jgi:hypothetical protein
VRALIWPVFGRSSWPQSATVVADTTGEGAALASVRLVGVVPDRYCGFVHEVRALLWPLFLRSAWVQPATVEAVTTGEGAALACLRSVGMGSASHCGGGHDRGGRCSGFYALGRCELSQPLWWRARQLRVLLWPLFSRWAWAKPATAVVGTTGEGAALASVISVGEG